MSNRFGLSDSLLDAVKNITANGTKVDKHAAFGLTEMSSKEKMKRGLYNSKMDPVGKEDDDIDNDGDSDKSDDYLKNRRKAIKKSMGKEAKVEINPEIKEEVEEIDELKKSTLSSYIKKAARQVGGASRASKDFERDAERKRSPRKKDTDNRIALNFSKLAMKRKDGIGKAADKLAKEETKVDSGLENPHNCATHVYSESWGDGRTVTTMHADPDEFGNIAWYDVMFEHGIEKGVPIQELAVVKSESHMHSKRGKK